MVLEIRFTHPDDGQPIARDWSYDDEPFIVGRSETCTVTLPPADLSRNALAVSEPEETRLNIKCWQRVGYVQVTRGDGERKAILTYGDELVCGAGTYILSLRTASTEVFELSVVVPGRPRLVEPGMATVGVWNRKQIFDPTPEEDWRWLAALVTVVARTSAQRKGRALATLATAWHGEPWKANTQDRLDKVLHHLQHRGPVGDKQQAIASVVRNSGVIQPADYRAFRDEVQQRAVRHLTRADIGLLGWGYLKRGM